MSTGKEASARWRANNLERRREIDRQYYSNNPKVVRDRQLRMKFGITLVQFEEMLLAQGMSCAICKTKTPGGRWNSFQLDHCHVTKKVRGILCVPCNKALGHFKNNVDSLRSAIEYLTKQHEARQ